MAPTPETAPATASAAARVVAEIDRVSLSQALVDVDVANARVIDLTARLVTSQRRLAEVTAERDEARRQLAAATMVALPQTVASVGAGVERSVTPSTVAPPAEVSLGASALLVAQTLRGMAGRVRARLPRSR